jgi:hypothetical protein
MFSFLLVALGTLFFQSLGAVKLKEQESSSQTDSPIQLTSWEAFGVSMRQFLPFDVPIGSSWIPADKSVSMRVPWTNPPRIYTVSPSGFATIFLRVPGWLLLPLLVAGFSGLARHKP